MHNIMITPQDGLQNVINALPADGTPITLRLAPGEYREKVELRRPHTTIEGAGAACTQIVWGDAATDPHPDGSNVGTFRSYTLLVLAEDCHLRALTIHNSAGDAPGRGQCVALFADGDHFTCEDCHLLSHQDTLFTAPLPPKEVQPGGFRGPTQNLPRISQRHAYRRCLIKGDVDFIYGGAAAWFEDCDIVSLREGYATAASTPEGQRYGYVFRNCRFLGEGVADGSCYLGRPWRAFAKTVLLDCHIGAHIRPEGWHDWNKTDFHRQGLYAEYGCTGEGSSLTHRALFARALTDEEAAAITWEDFIVSL